MGTVGNAAPHQPINVAIRARKHCFGHIEPSNVYRDARVGNRALVGMNSKRLEERRN